MSLRRFDRPRIMDKPPVVPMVYSAIHGVQADIAGEGIAKDRKNQQQGYNFRGIDDMYNALSPLFAKHALLVFPRMLQRDTTERTTKAGGALFYTVVVCEFDFVAVADGSQRTVRMGGEAMDSADKSTNKALSAALKYTLMQTFLIPTEGDNDADATTHEVVSASKAKASRQAVIMDAADRAIALFAQGQEVAAYEQVSGITDGEEMLFLWSYLKEHSALRATLKRLAKADRAQQSGTSTNNGETS
jgi:hypothetical protein